MSLPLVGIDYRLLPFVRFVPACIVLTLLTACDLYKTSLTASEKTRNRRVGVYTEGLA
jgi:hypothetical protein